MADDLKSLLRTSKKPEVVLYVRHGSKCPHRQEERFQHCDCPKAIRWSVAGQQYRVSLHTRSWKHAEEEQQHKQRELDAQFLLGATPTPQLAAIKSAQPNIAQAVQTFLLRKSADGLSESTMRKLRYQFAHFESFLNARSKFFPSDVTVTDATEYRASLKCSDLTKIKWQGNIRGFIRFLYRGDRRDEMLDAFPKMKKTREGEARRKPKPLSEADLKKLLAHVPVTFASEPHKIPRVTAFIHAAVSTGLACVDMVHLERIALEKATDGILEIARRKTGKKAIPRIDTGLRKELMAVLNGNPRYVFWNGSLLSESATGFWQRDLRRLFKNSGLWIEGNLSHRFRDTAVDFWLKQGCTLTEIAAMLGDTEAIVQKHYADLASDRMKERLAKVPARTW